MTKLLEKAIGKLKELPKKERDRYANIVLDDMAWQEAFESSSHKLDQLSTGVLKDIKTGKFKKMTC